MTTPTLLRRVGLAGAALLVVVAAACSGGKSAPTSSPGASGSPPQADPVAQMFMSNRAKLKAPDDRVRAAVVANIEGMTTPMGGAPARTITIDLGVRNQDPTGDLVVVSMIPYQVGDPDHGQGARFYPVSNSAFSLRPGEARSISVELIRERVGQGAGPGQPGQTGPSVPAPRAVGALESGQGTGPAVGGPFDEATGLQILFVTQFAGAVPPDAWRNVNVVPDSEFESRYGAYMGYQLGIGVPLNQLA